MLSPAAHCVARLLGQVIFFLPIRLRWAVSVRAPHGLSIVGPRFSCGCSLARCPALCCEGFLTIPARGQNCTQSGRRPRDPRDWLTQYAVDYRYGGAEHRLDAGGYRELQERISRAVKAFVAETFRLTGTGPGDLESGR